MRKIETYMSEQELMGRLEQLRSEGVEERNITVISREEMEGTSLNYTDVNYKTSDGSAWDKIVAWFSAEDAEERMMSNLNLGPQEEDEYKEALNSGKILLYVNEEMEGDTTDYPKDPLLEDDADRVDTGEVADRPASSPDAARTAGAGALGAAGQPGNAYPTDTETPGEDRPHNPGAQRPEFDRDYDYEGEGADTRIVNDDMVEGRRDQHVVDNHRDDPLDDTEGRYSVDDRAVESGPGGIRQENVDDRALNNDAGVVGQDDIADRNTVGRGEFADRGDIDDDIARRDDLTDEEKLQLREERLRVDKENVQTGEVNVEKHTETERQEFDVPVEREEVSIERRPVDDERPAGSIDAADDESINIPVSEERVNVDKEDVVNEEVVIKKDKVRDTEHVSEDVRREEVDIDETTNDRNTLDEDLDRDRLDRDRR